LAFLGDVSEIQRFGEDGLQALDLDQARIRRPMLVLRRLGVRGGLTGFLPRSLPATQTTAQGVSDFQAFSRKGLHPSGKRGSKRSTSEAPFASSQATNYCDLQALYEAGATGLEPATSGVTGLFHEYDDWRRLTCYRSIDAALRALAADLRKIA
jgi:hypothetical protein